MIDIVGNDGPAPGDFIAHKFRRDEFGNGGSEGFSRMLGGEDFAQGVQSLVFADGDEFHFRGNDATAGVVHLGDIGTGLCPQGFADVFKAQGSQLGIGLTRLAVAGTGAGQFLYITPFPYPGLTQGWQSLTQIDIKGRIGIRPGGIVDINRRIGFSPLCDWGIRLGNFPHRYPDIGAAARNMDFFRGCKGLDGCTTGRDGFVQKIFGHRVHRALQ